MSGGHSDYETYKHEHEVLPKWGKLVSSLLTPKPTDSAWKTALRFGGLVTSPVLVGPPTLGIHAYDEIMYNHFTPFLGLPGYLQYKGSRALFGPKPGFLSSSQKITLPPRPFKFTTIPTVRNIPPPKIAIRTQPTPRTTPPTPSRSTFNSLSDRSMANNLRLSQPSWGLKLKPTFSTPPSINTRMTLTPNTLGSSLPYRPFTANLGLGIPKLTMGRF